MDVAHGEKVEKELDAMIERRSRRKDPEEEHQLWEESVRGSLNRRVAYVSRLDGKAVESL